MEDVAASVGDESVSMAWLEEAIGHTHAHGQMKAQAYLEAVMEDVVFVRETVERKPFSVG